jgi:HEPN domain-containing protein
MKQRTREWIEKAEGDWKMAQREVRAADPVWDGVCFHAQQCAEKYLKAFLEEHQIAFEKTHDLAVLLNLSGELFPELHSIRTELASLSTFGVAARYPGVQADRQAAEDAMRTAQEVRDAARTKFGLS